MLVYISGPISNSDQSIMRKNVQRAAEIAGKWMKVGHAVICPHTNSVGIEDAGYQFDHATWMKSDLTMLARCDAIVMVEGWETSKGACEELEYATKLGIPVHFGINPVGLHRTEERCPIQCKEFAETLGKMYRTHLQKNADYSPANIMGTGSVGVITRLWDKMARLMSLVGFNLVIAEPATYSESREPNNESIEDTFIDLANYAIIARILRVGKWGK